MASTLPPLAQAVAGSVGATISNALVFPLDTLTTRLQASNRRRRPAPVSTAKVPPSKSSTTLVEAIRSLWNSGGWSAFYAGLGPDSLSTAISQFLYFFCYSFLRDRLLAKKLKAGSPGKSTLGKVAEGKGNKGAPPPLLTAVEELLIGCVAGIVAKGFVSPLSMIAVRQQTSSEPRQEVIGGKQGDKRPVEKGDGSSSDEDDEYGSPPSAIKIAKEIYESQGLKGFWSGFQSTVVLTVNPAITFYAFAALKRALIPAKHREHPTPLQTFFCGAFASSLASLITYPLILAKTRLQFKSPTGRALYASPFDVFRRAYKRHGFAGLYAGVEGQLLKGFVNEGLKLLIKERLELMIVLIAQIAYRRKALARA
ncbi:uncharacterized protein JCM6883_004344 [Sporobolomyces salmoneus]|uniref:uncharacterized protein n=1 Tax=Sporobolomyces salmoneus TaxID=183962 RepID=UPI00317BDB88